MKGKVKFVYVFKQKSLGTYGSGVTAPHDLDFGTRLEVIGQHGAGIFHNNDIG
jgi:hypothetical protein